MAIEDSAALALALLQAPTVSDALTACEGWRRPRTARIQQLLAATDGSITWARPLASFRNLAAPRARGTTMDWLYRYDARNHGTLDQRVPESLGP